jgi:4-hydroxybenzoate polyprenyltransferase
MSSNVTRQPRERPEPAPAAGRRAVEVWPLLRAAAWAACLLFAAGCLLGALSLSPARYGQSWADAAAQLLTPLACFTLAVFAFDRLSRFPEGRG